MVKGRGLVEMLVVANGVLCDQIGICLFFASMTRHVATGSGGKFWRGVEWGCDSVWLVKRSTQTLMGPHMEGRALIWRGLGSQTPRF